MPAAASTKTEVAFTQPFECRAVRTGHVGIQRLSGRYEPGVVLAHTSRSTALQERTPLCLREVYTLKNKALQ